MRHHLPLPFLCQHCGSLLQLAEKELKLYKAAGFLTEGSGLLSRCAYCIGKRRRVDVKHELPRRIDASYPYGVITALPGNTFTETGWIEPLSLPKPRPGHDPCSPFAVLTTTEGEELACITSWLCAEFTRHASSANADFKLSPVPRFSKSLCMLGEAAIHDSLDAVAVRSAFDEWIAEHEPKRWIRTLATMFREAFAMRADGQDSEAILKSLHEKVGA